MAKTETVHAETSQEEGVQQRGDEVVTGIPGQNKTEVHSIGKTKYFQGFRYLPFTLDLGALHNLIFPAIVLKCANNRMYQKGHSAALIWACVCYATLLDAM